MPQWRQGGSCGSGIKRIKRHAYVCVAHRSANRPNDRRFRGRAIRRDRRESSAVLTRCERYLRLLRQCWFVGGIDLPLDQIRPAAGYDPPYAVRSFEVRRTAMAVTADLHACRNIGVLELAHLSGVAIDDVEGAVFTAGYRQM